MSTAEIIHSEGPRDLASVAAKPPAVFLAGPEASERFWVRAYTPRRRMKAFSLGLVVVLVLASTCYAQTNAAASPSSKEVFADLQRNMPSESEFSELLAKADQNVSAFESAVKGAQPALDRVDVNLAKNYMDAASTAHKLISQTIKNGATAYRLVGILITLDDLSLDAANGSKFLLAADQEHSAAKVASLGKLSAAGTSCSDISELIFHATMRLLAAEETALNKLLESQN